MLLSTPADTFGLGLELQLFREIVASLRCDVGMCDRWSSMQ